MVKRSTGTLEVISKKWRTLCYFYLFVAESVMLKWGHLMCEWRVEDVGKVPILQAPLTGEATDASQFMPKKKYLNLL